MSRSTSGADPHPPDDDEIKPATQPLSRWRSAWDRWQRARRWFARAMEPTHGALPFDLIDIGVSAVGNAFARVVRLVAAPAAGTALGVWAIAFDSVDSWNPRTWPTPLDLVYHDGHWDFSDLASLPLVGTLTWAFSFIGCFQTPWLFPLWIATIFIQFWWSVTAVADLESRWLAPATIVAAAIQVYASAVAFEPARFGIAFLVVTGASILVVQWVRLWMLAHDLTPWDWFHGDRSEFDPAFHRWRRSIGGPPQPTSQSNHSPNRDDLNPPATPPD